MASPYENADKTALSSTAASCWVWRTLWEERKRRQKRIRQQEASGTNRTEAAVAPKPLQFRLLDAVLFDEGGAQTGSAGIFTSRSGELMRRTKANLELPAVRGRMAQLALGIFRAGQHPVIVESGPSPAPTK
eukprot:CAMPEP_0119492438 /NCGR_PEP_ID=MMETSP1344-20130328/16989_1 /TAXON_ID=236787 /ORGANISM="Florenciella parvula, Strain CCMP2471" /LENGTH=131 /DNA_ID=CAMNT_0007527769 /DNA_START=71 /DNA_END=463 /DNA_ORIENTATION=-